MHWLVWSKHSEDIKKLCKLRKKNFNKIIRTKKNTDLYGHVYWHNDNLVGFVIYDATKRKIKVKYLVVHPDYTYEALIKKLIKKLSPYRNKIEIHFGDNYELAFELQEQNFIFRNGIAIKTYESTLVKDIRCTS